MKGAKPPESDDGKRLAFRSQASARISADRLSLFLFFFCVFAILGQIALILSSWGKLPPKLPLFYLRAWGNAILAPTQAIWILPAVATLFFLMNYFLAFFVMRDNFYLLRVLVIFSSIICFATLYDVTKIVALLI